MAENEYHARWSAIEKENRAEAGIIGLGCANPVLEERAVRRTLTTFLAEIYANHWRPGYESLGIELTDPRDVFEARAIEVHHWLPEIVSKMSMETLTQALAEDFSHIQIPHQALQVIHQRTTVLPERNSIVRRFPA